MILNYEFPPIGGGAEKTQAKEDLRYNQELGRRQRRSQANICYREKTVKGV